MNTTAIIVVDTDASHDLSGVENAVNGLAKRAENSGQPFFYVIEEGAEIPDSIEKPSAFSVLRYENEENWYKEARVDEQIENRDIDKVVCIGASGKEEELKQKEKERGRGVAKGRDNNGNGNGKGNKK